MSKRVFILGAGFSIPAGAPSQEKIINTILEMKGKYHKSRQQKKVDSLIEDFESFLTNVLLIKRKDFSKVPLEDVYTPLDRCIIEDISFRGITTDKLIETKEKINKLIVLALRQSLQTPNKDYIEKFADYLIEQTRVRKIMPSDDRISVITTNWDILLDNILQQKLDKLKPKKDDFDGVVDYCCYVSSLKENDKRIKPGLFALGKKKFNVKLLKLHGSTNWYTCPKCQRLFLDFYINHQGGIALSNSKKCSHCKENFALHDSYRLRTNLIMPTFLKNLDNFQNKLIWQNAGIELSEAEEIVFIGYSLPYADFELRQLLSRMLRDKVKVRVVLWKTDKPKKGFENYSAGYRFETFFSGREPHITYEGVDKFVANEL